MERILLGVNDSAAAMAAADLAVDLAARLGADLCAVCAVPDHELGANLSAALPGAAIAARRRTAADAVLAHVARLGAAHGVPVRTVALERDPAAAILDQVRSWPADLIVIGHARGHGGGRPYVGALTQHLLEFADRPVLVVPVPDQVL